MDSTMPSEDQQSQSSISEWLEDHPKRATEYDSCDRPPRLLPPIKRRKLADMSHNIVSPRRQSPRKQAGSSSRQARLRRARTPSIGRDHDDEPTPQPKSLGNPPRFDPHAQSRSRSTTQSDASRRSRSPTKKLGDFQLSDTPVETIRFGTPGFPVPDGAKQLYHDLRSIGRAKKIIPREIQSKAAGLDDFEEEWIMEEEAQTFENGLGCDAVWERVAEIRAAAGECYNYDLAEPAWNSEVHSTILRLALRGEWEAKGVWYNDITTVRIHDPALLPSTTTGAMSSKMVDFALLLRKPYAILSSPSRKSAFHQRVLDLLRAEQRQSINHAMSEAIRFSPIAVSIETKRAGIDEDGVKMQLGTWVAAHFARLRQLMQYAENKVLPTLPLLFVQGDEWKLKLAQWQENSVIILGDLTLGATNCIVGIYQIIAAIRRLAKWVDEEYRIWFEKEILDIER